MGDGRVGNLAWTQLLCRRIRERFEAGLVGERQKHDLLLLSSTTLAGYRNNHEILVLWRGGPEEFSFVCYLLDAISFIYYFCIVSFFGSLGVFVNGWPHEWRSNPGNPPSLVLQPSS